MPQEETALVVILAKIKCSLGAVVALVVACNVVGDKVYNNFHALFMCTLH